MYVYVYSFQARTKRRWMAKQITTSDENEVSFIGEKTGVHRRYMSWGYNVNHVYSENCSSKFISVCLYTARTQRHVNVKTTSTSKVGHWINVVSTFIWRCVSAVLWIYLKKKWDNQIIKVITKLPNSNNLTKGKSKLIII